MKTWDNDLNFNLKWWGLDLDTDTRWREYRKLGMSGITVVGMSPAELRLIKQWTVANEVYKVTRLANFEDVLSMRHFRNTNNQAGVRHFEYVEHELCLFDGYDKILDFECFLDSLPKRSMETFVLGRSVQEVRKICRAVSHRILPDINDEELMVASVDDKDVFLQLNLISSQE